MFVVHVARDCVSGGSQLLPLGDIAFNVFQTDVKRTVLHQWV